MSYFLRLSFNINNWEIPSGHFFKSNHEGSHEFEFGFGFEEWFFNKRRFKDKNKDSIHLGYLDPLRHFDPENMEKKDLVLYTLKKNQENTKRYIVSKIAKSDWEYISSEDYTLLRLINGSSIQEMRNELLEAMPVLRSNIIMKRFNQQVDGQDCAGLENQEHRLWNISIKENALKLIMEEVDSDTLCPDWHINNLQMFRLYNSENFNHEKCLK
jgi:hypothetical protein